jgi:hypothetical protein
MATTRFASLVLVGAKISAWDAFLEHISLSWYCGKYGLLLFPGTGLSYSQHIMPAKAKEY